jgi:hypothetical protein
MRSRSMQKKSDANSMSQAKKTRVIKNLAEAIILQSMEDIWVAAYRKDSRDFFSGDGFKICSEIAGLDAVKQFKVLNLIGGKNNGRHIRVH